MSNNNPQQVMDAGEALGQQATQVPVPQASPAQPSGPDSHSLGKMSDVVGKTTSPSTDWESRYKGFDRFYQQQFRALESQVGQIVSAIEKLGTPSEPTAAPEPVQESSPDMGNLLGQATARAQAQTYRDTLLAAYSAPGAPGAGLNLTGLREYIPVVPPKVSEDGTTLDDSEQRAAIEGFINKLSDVASTARTAERQAITAGSTPASSPGAPTPTDPVAIGDEKYKRFQELMTLYGSEQFVDMLTENRAGAREIEQEYYRLQDDPEVQARHGGDLGTTLSTRELTEQVKKMARQIEQMGNKNPLGAAFT